MKLASWIWIGIGSVFALAFCAITYVGFFIWAHHMFIMGVSNYSALALSVSTVLGAIAMTIIIFIRAFGLRGRS